MSKNRKQSSPSPLGAHLGFWLRFVSNHVSARFQKLLETSGTTVSEWVALRTLQDRDVSTHAQLIDALGMTKGAVSKLVSRLEEKGLVQRHLAEADAREQLLLTPAGLALVPQLAALADENEQYFFAHLDSDERRALMDALEHLATHHGFKQIPLA